jgi:hypothetical protein
MTLNFKLSHYRLRRDDGEGGEVLPVWSGPDLVETGKHEILLILRVNIVWRFALTLALIFIEATGRHQAPIRRYQAAKGWPLRQRLDSSVSV